ncbi:hypothetical protein P3L10_007578 [Capsicum annuum]
MGRFTFDIKKSNQFLLMGHRQKSSFNQRRRFLLPKSLSSTFLAALIAEKPAANITCCSPL